MAIYKFPSEPGKKKDPKKDKKTNIHHPEFIDIEDLQYEEILQEEPEIGEAFGGFHKIDLPFSLRIFIFGISWALFMGSILLSCLSILFGLLNLVTFRYIEVINHQFLSYWRRTKRLFVIALGLLITAFSPSLGAGFITLYFALQGESVKGNFVDRLFKS